MTKTFKELQVEAKSLGVNTFGLSRDALEAAIAGAKGGLQAGDNAITSDDSGGAALPPLKPAPAKCDEKVSGAAIAQRLSANLISDENGCLTLEKHGIVVSVRADQALEDIISAFGNMGIR